MNNGQVNSIRRYLLEEELSEQEREQIEDRLMSDEDLYHELLVAEDDLIDDYVSNSLPEEERTKFRRRFLHVPELRQKVSFTAALRKHALETAPQVVAAERAPSRSWFDWTRRFSLPPAFAASFAALLLVAIGAGAWLVKQNSQLRSRVEQLEANRQTTPPAGTTSQEELKAADLRNKQLSDEVQRQQQELEEKRRELQLAQAQQKAPTPRTTPPVTLAHILAVPLTSGFVRDSGEWTKVDIPANKRQVRFQLDVAGDDFPRYKAVLETVEEEPKRKWSSERLEMRTGNIVPFDVPARVLVSGDDYQITLSGVDSSNVATDINTYYFRVRK